jgi:hypothetical protein
MNKALFLGLIRGPLKTALEKQYSYSQFRDQDGKLAIEYHTDHGTNFDMSQVIEMVMTEIKTANNNKLPFINIKVNDAYIPPFKKALSPANLLRVYPLYELLSELKTREIVVYRAHPNPPYRFKMDRIEKYSSERNKIYFAMKERTTDFRCQIVVEFKSKVLLITHEQRRYPLNPVHVALYPNILNPRYCKYQVQNITFR